MPKHKKHRVLDHPSGQRVEAAQEFDDEGSLEVGPITVPDSTTDMEVTGVEIDLSNLKSIWIEADGALTLETNDGSTPTDTITFTATKKIYDWDENSLFTNLITGDITGKIYLSNSSGASRTFRLYAIQDATP